MEAVFDWVKGIVFYLILLTVVNHLVPNQKYGKYIRLFTGMLLIMMVIRPVTQVFSWNEQYDMNFLKILGESVEFEWDDETMAGDLEDVQERQLLAEYERQVKAFVEAEAKALGITVTDVQVEAAREEDIIVPERIRMKASVSATEKGLDEITIADIIIEEQKGNVTEEISNLQKVLAQYYGIEESRIQISGR